MSLKPKILKAQFTISFLFEEDQEEAIRNMSVADLLDEMDFGSIIGQVGSMTFQQVPFRNVHKELLNIGNDGTFFDAG